jgi:single-strand DNA-binding protein
LLIIGNLTRDPELRTTQNGKTVCSFSVAVNRRKQEGKEQVTDYFKVTVWNQAGESRHRWLKKGKKVAVLGQVSVNIWKNDDGEARASLEVLANEVEFLSPKEDDGEEPKAKEEKPRMIPVDDGEELPF